MKTDHPVDASANQSANQSANAEQEPGRYTARIHSQANDIAESHLVQAEALRQRQEQNAHYISQQLRQLYDNINQHVNTKLGEIDDCNKDISDLIVNLNTQLNNSLEK